MTQDCESLIYVNMTTPTTEAIGNKVSQWGEGPIWWGEHLLYVDIEGHKLIRLDPVSGDEAEWDVG